MPGRLARRSDRHPATSVALSLASGRAFPRNMRVFHLGAPGAGRSSAGTRSLRGARAHASIPPMQLAAAISRGEEDGDVRLGGSAICRPALMTKVVDLLSLNTSTPGSLLLRRVGRLTVGIVPESRIRSASRPSTPPNWRYHLLEETASRSTRPPGERVPEAVASDAEPLVAVRIRAWLCRLLRSNKSSISTSTSGCAGGRCLREWERPTASKSW